MNPHIEWQQPQIVWDWKKQTMKAELWQLWLLMTKAVCVLWAIALPLAYYWGPSAFSPQELERWFKFMILVGLLIPTMFVLVFIGVAMVTPSAHLFRNKYFLTTTGATWRGMGPISWKRIESYRFTNHPKLPNIRVLELKVKDIKMGITIAKGTWCHLDFDPTITSEAEIESLIRHYLTPT